VTKLETSGVIFLYLLVSLGIAIEKAVTTRHAIPVFSRPLAHSQDIPSSLATQRYCSTSQ
jgi:hypothetical protein